ncbi:MAG: flavodoxin [Alphaproteobacteria bacterium]
MKKLLMTALLGTTMAATTAEAKTLVAYFSLTGNTEKAAQIIAEETGADLYRIESETPYPAEYKAQTEVAKKELSEGILRPIKPWPENMADYDVVFVGSPVWWGTMATPVHTFLASGALKGKKVIPFVTHGGSGADKSFTDTAKLCQGCQVNENGWSGYSRITMGLGSWAKKSLEEARQ